MSWIDREIRRRAAASKRSAAGQSVPVSAADRIQELWHKLERANAALPSELQLRAEQGDAAASVLNEATFVTWLRAPNGAGVGFATDAIRYVWPEMGRRWSNNFWIRWDPEQRRYLVNRRVGTMANAKVASCRFDETRIDYIVRRLVMGKRIRIGAIRKKRLGLF